MYTIHVDGKLLYQTGAEDEAQIALNVKPSLDIESAGSLSFVLPPGNGQYNAIRKMKSIITMHQDDRQIFRGRVTESEKDFFNQKDVYCEGDRSFLLDSLWEEQIWTGKVQELFRHLIANHNDQVEEDKRFQVGIITAVDAETPYEAEMRVETRKYWDTYTIIDERLVGAYGGYIRTRTEGGITYIDWLADFEEESGQDIRFGVNLLDVKDKVDAKEVFTCLIPLGYSEIGEDGTYEDPVDITSVNGGLNYIQDDAGVALYGKIWRTHTWGMTKDPAALKAKAMEHMKTGAALRTLVLTSLDMHFVSGDISMIRIGTKVHIDSDPHGIHLHMVCVKMDIDPDNPEKTKYTFGMKPRTLHEAVIRTEKETGKLSGKGRGGSGGGGKSIQEEALDIIRWAKLIVDEANGLISANAGEIDKIEGRTSSVELILNGKEGTAGLIAQVQDQGGRLSSAELILNGAEGQAGLVAQVQDQDGRLSSAELILNGKDGEVGLVARMGTAEAAISANSGAITSKVSKGDIASTINQTAQSVLISAKKIDLDGYVTVDNLAAHIADITSLDVTRLEASQGIETEGLIVRDRFHFLGSQVSKTTLPIVTSFTQALGESAPTQEYTLLTCA